MDIHELKELIFDKLEDPIAQLGCAGPPECKQEGCDSKGLHSTGLATFGGVIEVEIDDRTYEIRVEDVTSKQEKK